MRRRRAAFASRGISEFCSSGYRRTHGIFLQCRILNFRKKISAIKILRKKISRKKIIVKISIQKKSAKKNRHKNFREKNSAKKFSTEFSAKKNRPFRSENFMMQN
jgi:hypothetical protein